MATNEFLPHATGSGANVLDQATWLASAARISGFLSGRASSAAANKALRQSTSIAAMIAQFAADRSGADMMDGGDIAGLEGNFARAIRKQSDNFVTTGVGGTVNAIVLTLSAPPGSWAELVGAPLRLIIPAANTSQTVTVGVTGLSGTQLLISNTGAPLRVGALQPGAIVEIISDGTFMRMVSGSMLGGFVGVKSYSAAGTYTYTPSIGVTSALAHVLGAGGGGGGAAGNTNPNNVSTGSGGNAGSYGIGAYAISGPVTVTVGDGGAGGVGASGTGGAGGNGGASSFGAFLSAIGGLGGQVGGPTTPPYGSAGFSQSRATGGTILNAAGQPGGLSLGILAANGGYGGPGGVGPYGGGAQSVAPNANGIAGDGPGCGGGGTCVTGVSGPLTGGKGAPGLVLVYEFTN